MTGAPTFIARSITLQIFSACVSLNHPPKTVKYCANTNTSRPSTRPWPVTTPSPGNFCSSIPKSVERWTTNLSNSSKLPSSRKKSIRSRAVILPAARCFSTRAEPPPSSAAAERSLSSSILFFVLDSGVISHKCSYFNPLFKTSAAWLNWVAHNEDRADNKPRQPTPRARAQGARRQGSGHDVYRRPQTCRRGHPIGYRDRGVFFL